MTKIPVLAAAAALAFSLLASMAQAGAIERACNKSDRDAANRAVCSCIQQVADITLNGSDQRRAAKLFNDPDQAQNVFMSKRSADDAFWERYKNFAASAEGYCAG